MKKKFLSLFTAALMAASLLVVMPAASAGAEEYTTEIKYPFGYESDDAFVKDALLGLAYDEDGNSLGFSNVASSTSEFAYQELAEDLIDNKNWLIGVSEFWTYATKCIDTDFVGLVTWKKEMYETIIMDWLTYDFESSEYEEEYDADVSKYEYDLTKEFIDKAEMTDSSKVDSLDVKKASDFLDQNFWEQEVDMGDPGVMTSVLDDITSGVETTSDLIKNLSKAMAIRKASVSRINFLEEVYAATDDTDLQSAILDVITKINANYAIVALGEVTKSSASLIISKSWDSFLAGLTSAGVCTPFVETLGMIKLGKDGIDLIFNTSDLAEYNLQLTTLYIINSDFKNVYENKYGAAIGTTDPQVAAEFNDAYLSYWSYQAFATNICNENMTEKLINAILQNQTSIFLKNNNIQTYADWVSQMQTQMNNFKGKYELQGKLYKLYNDMFAKYNGLNVSATEESTSEEPAADAGAETSGDCEYIVLDDGTVETVGSIMITNQNSDWTNHEATVEVGEGGTYSVIFRNMNATDGLTNLGYIESDNIEVDLNLGTIVVNGKYEFTIDTELNNIFAYEDGLVNIWRPDEGVLYTSTDGSATLVKVGDMGAGSIVLKVGDDTAAIESMTYNFNVTKASAKAPAETDSTEPTTEPTTDSEEVTIPAVINTPEGMTISKITVEMKSSTTDNTITVTIVDGKITIKGILNGGSYTLTFSAENCAPHTYSATVKDGEIVENLSIELNLYGDISGDGELDIKDMSKVYKDINSTSPLEGYSKDVANVNNDDSVDIKDYSKIYKHVNETAPLW